MTKEKELDGVLWGQKSYDELTFTDNFLFCKIMEKNPKLCRQLLEMVLKVKIKKLVFSKGEETIGVTPQGKSVRLDVYVADEAGTVYDLEMQVAPNKNLPKRMRYYQGMIDLNLIEKGADYKQLCKSFIIFICTFDFFKKGLPVYTFTNRCSELLELELGDDTVKIFINPNGDTTDLSEDMTAFLKYLKGEMTENNVFVNEVDQEVSKAGSCEEWRVEYMTLMMEYKERYNEGFLYGVEQGIEQGIKQGIEQGIEQGVEQGIEQGIERGIEQGLERGMEAFILDKLEDDVPKQRVVEKLQKRFGLSEKEAICYYDKVSGASHSES